MKKLLHHRALAIRRQIFLTEKWGGMDVISNFDGESVVEEEIFDNDKGNQGGINNFEDHLQRMAVNSLFYSHRPKMPWEKAPFHDVLCRPKPLVPVPELQQCFVGLMDATQHLLPRHPEIAKPARVSTFANKRRRVQESAVTPDDLRCKSLLLLKTILESRCDGSVMGRQLKQARLQGRLDQTWTIVEDSFGVKKTGTLYKRARSLWVFYVWAKQWKALEEFDWSDDLVYGYLCHARAHNKAPTHGLALLQAFNFLHAIADLDEYKGFSARVKGVAKLMHSHKRDLKQARQLRVEEVKALEDFVLSNAEEHLRFIAGYNLFCLMAVCRHADPMYAVNWCISKSGRIVLLEAGTRYHKTAGSGSRSTVLLPLVALGNIFRDDRSWAEEWLSLKKRLVPSDVPHVLPSWSERISDWLPRAMTANEASLWLKEFIQLQIDRISDVSTHSLKCTLLSWNTIAGTMTLEQRRTMGHHVDPSAKSPLTYGRENLVSIQAIVAALLWRIRNGSFDPDAPRAQLIETELETLINEINLHQLPMPADAPADMCEGLVEEDEDFDAEVVDVQASLCEATPHVYLDAERVAGRAMQHSTSGVIHVLGPDRKFLCGRGVTKSYGHLESGVALQWPLCRQCECVAGPDFIAELQSEGM